MRPRSRQGDGQVTVRVHPPERRRRTGNVAACGCCCCCCCCLHSIGGLIGSAVTRRSKTPEDFSTTTIYWVCLLIILLFSLATPFMLAAASDEIGFGLLLTAMLLPAGQLVASLLAGIVARITVGPSALHRIWSITWRGFMGAVIGLGIMLIPLFAANDSPKGMFLVILGLLIVSGFLYSIRRRPQRA